MSLCYFTHNLLYLFREKFETSLKVQGSDFVFEKIRISFIININAFTGSKWPQYFIYHSTSDLLIISDEKIIQLLTR